MDDYGYLIPGDTLPTYSDGSVQLMPDVYCPDNTLPGSDETFDPYGVDANGDGTSDASDYDSNYESNFESNYESDYESNFESNYESNYESSE